MTKERLSARPSLKDAVKQDYPAASEILLSFPETWELIDVLKSGERLSPIYVGAFPASEEKPSREHFAALSPEINLALNSYRLYKFFQPWAMPNALIDWNARTGVGQVTGYGDTKINMQPIGQAQVWYGKNVAVIWECYFNESRRTMSSWEENLARVWEIVEKDVAVGKIFTTPHEPEFVKGYRDFLLRLGYAQDREHPIWCSKSIG